MFDPAARGLLGLPRPRGRGRDRADAHPGARRQGRGHQDLAPRRGPRDRPAPPPARGRADVHRRRLQLPRADRGRRARASATRCSASSTRSRPPRRPRSQPRPAATAPATASSWPPPSRSRARSSRRRPQYYKAGVVLLAWLNGHQDHFVMVGGMQSARSAPHYAAGVPARRRGGAAARPGAGLRQDAQPHGDARRRLTARPPRFPEPLRRREPGGTPEAQPWTGPAPTPRPWSENVR